ncbi:MAG: GDSL-type esterase/lipase family protein [Flavobacteriaceae bacterium]|nr:GDSL-type esterase/lipase family protein [Flavobacteriaceae bacterium]
MRKFIKIHTAIIIILSSFSLVFGQSHKPFFKNGDIICFLGDSITHGGQYHEFLQLFYATRYPNLKLTFHNCGISGDNAAGMIDRFEEDVMKHKPTHVFLMTGMNDVQRTLYFEGTASNKILKQRANALANYKRNTTLLVEKIIENNIIPILLTPSIYDQYSKIERENNLGCNDALIECSNHIKKLGDKYDALVIDLNTPMRKLMERELKKDSLFTIVGKDRVHPESTGHFIMFHEIISSLEAPAVVSKIAINVNQNEEKIRVQNLNLQDATFSDSLISFQTSEMSLPFPMGRSLHEAISLTSFKELYNQQLFQAEGLPNKNYDLFIDKQHIGTFDAYDLKRGINLSQYKNTPQYKQAQEIKRLCTAYRQTQYQLRAVAFIRHSYLNDYTGPDSINLKYKHLSKKLKRIENKPYYNYIKSSMEAYFETLPKIDSLEKRKRQLSEQLNSIHTPKMQQWKLIKSPSPRI